MLRRVFRFKNIIEKNVDFEFVFNSVAFVFILNQSNKGFDQCFHFFERLVPQGGANEDVTFGFDHSSKFSTLNRKFGGKM